MTRVRPKSSSRSDRGSKSIAAKEPTLAGPRVRRGGGPRARGPRGLALGARAPLRGARGLLDHAGPRALAAALARRDGRPVPGRDADRTRRDGALALHESGAEDYRVQEAVG